MRRMLSLCTFLLIILTAGVALSQVNGQATMDRGYASNWVVPPGYYAVPWVPLLSTPSMSFPSPQLQVGASNATEGNVAGASNSTFTTGGVQQSSAARGARVSLGISTFQDDYGVATLAGIHGSGNSQPKVYTNDDVERLKSKDAAKN